MSSVAATPARPTVVVVAPDVPMSDLAVLEPIRARARLAIVADPPALERSIADADILLLWDFGVDVSAVLPSATRLRWIHVAAVGVDGLINPALRDRGITLTNSRGVFDRAMAEYVLTLYLMHLKGIRDTLDLQRARMWKHRPTREVTGTSAAVVGTGSIGREIARMLASVGVDVELVGRRRSHDPVFGTVRAASELADIVAGHDLVVLAAPLTPQTVHLVDQHVLDEMEGAYLVNVGRGALIDQAALIDALRGGTIAGAALDVFDEEPLPVDSPLWSDPDAVVSPHMSGDFIGSDTALMQIFVDNLDRWRVGEPLRGVVDLDLGYVPSATG